MVDLSGQPIFEILQFETNLLSGLLILILAGPSLHLLVLLLLPLHLLLPQLDPLVHGDRVVLANQQNVRLLEERSGDALCQSALEGV